MIFSIILAGGKGLRMGSGIPKQFLLIREKPIIIHTLEKFLNFKDINKIYIGVPEDWIVYTKKMLNDFNIDSGKIRIVGGGSERHLTLFNVMQDIYLRYGKKDHIVLTHDSVRPFITDRIIEENINCSVKHGACSTAIKSVDTLAISNDGVTITDIPDRNIMYQIQTPQTFKFKELYELYKSLTENQKSRLTDACKIFDIKGRDIKIVRGEVFNIKITSQEDYKIALSIYENLKK